MKGVHEDRLALGRAPHRRSAQEASGPAGLTRLRRSLAHFARGVIWLDRFVRTAYFGFTVMLVVLGAGLAVDEIGGRLLLGLLLSAACFQVYSYVLNDVIDLPVDASQPRRASDPLVRGLSGEGLSRRSGLVIALLPLPLAALVTLWLGGNAEAWLCLGAAYLGLGQYNLWGKRFAAPPLTDFVQGCGWAALALYGARIAAPDLAWPLLIDRMLPLLALTVGLIVLITGVHGGLRDLVNDLRQGRTNASAFLGARPARPDDPQSITVTSSAGVVLYAFAWLAGMSLPALLFLQPDRAHYAGSTAQLAALFGTLALLVVNAYVLWQVCRPQQPERDTWISRQAVTLWLPSLLLYLPCQLLSPTSRWLLLGAFAIPPLFQVKTGRWLLRQLGSEEPH